MKKLVLLITSFLALGATTASTLFINTAKPLNSIDSYNVENSTITFDKDHKDAYMTFGNKISSSVSGGFSKAVANYLCTANGADGSFSIDTPIQRISKIEVRFSCVHGYQVNLNVKYSDGEGQTFIILDDIGAYETNVVKNFDLTSTKQISNINTTSLNSVSGEFTTYYTFNYVKLTYSCFNK